MEILKMFLDPKNIIWGIINFGFYAAFFYYLLYSIKKKVDLIQASIVLAILASLMIITCPIINKIISG